MAKKEKEHWIFKKHTNNIQLLVEIALYLKSNRAGVSIEEKEQMYKRLSQTVFYNPRASLRNEPLDAINHKLDGLTYYMFGYSAKLNNELKFIFSPLGNLFLKYFEETDKAAQIFSTMLIGMQFPHPASQKSENFELYPFRLIFRLLLDPRLNYKLYHYEVYKYLIYIKEINAESYELLIKQILKSRQLEDEEKFTLLKQEEHSIVKSVYEWEYYVAKLLAEVKILDVNYGNDLIWLFHPKKENSKSNPTKRKATNGYFSLNKKVKSLVVDLLEKHTVFDKPLSLSDEKELSKDIIKQIYLFYPDELLVEIGEKPTLNNEVLKIPELVKKYSLNDNNETHGDFEEILTTAFNMFINVDAEWLAGPGKTDIECIYTDIKEKFSVEAKSTKNKLTSLNAGRLKRHRKLIGAKYTIVITPKYVPSIKYDIEEENIVIITSYTLSEYLYNNIISGIEMDFTEIRDIATNNFGHDISMEVSELTLSRFG